MAGEVNDAGHVTAFASIARIQLFVLGLLILTSSCYVLDVLAFYITFLLYSVLSYATQDAMPPELGEK